MSSQKQMQNCDTTLPQEEQLAEMADRREKQTAEIAGRKGQAEPKPVDNPEITPHFFKIIVSPHASKLHIPNEFVTEYEVNLGDFVLLEVPNGVVWKVKLQNSNGSVWFKEGWNKFMEYYSIGAGYFTLFRYKGNSQFCVFIFDLGATEIEYPPGPIEDMTPENRRVAVKPPKKNRVNIPPPVEPPAENAINLPPPGIYTMEELSRTSMPSLPKV